MTHTISVKITTPINAVTENQPYFWNGKAYELQTGYTDAVRWHASPTCTVTSKLKAMSGSSSHYLQGAGAYCGSPTTSCTASLNPYKLAHLICIKTMCRIHVHHKNQHSAYNTISTYLLAIHVKVYWQQLTSLYVGSLCKASWYCSQSTVKTAKLPLQIFHITGSNSIIIMCTT